MGGIASFWRAFPLLSLFTVLYTQDGQIYPCCVYLSNGILRINVQKHTESVRSISFKDSNSFCHTLLQKAWTHVPYHQQISNFDSLWTTNALLSKQALPYPTEKTMGLERVNGLSRRAFHPLNQNWSFERVTQKSNGHFPSVQAVPALLSGSDRQSDLWHSDHGITFGVQGQPPPGLISFPSLCSVYWNSPLEKLSRLVQ